MPKRTNVFQKLVFLVKKHVPIGATVTEVLVSRAGFTKEATRVARSYGIEVISWDAIDAVRVTGSCNFDISEFRLQRGILGNVRIAWGTGSFLGKEVLLVASEDQVSGRKLSITTESTEKHPTTRSSGAL